jgi:transcription-repair coupling factor (superfamily II helicase)
LMVSSLEKLTPDVRRRLEAVVRYSELGSGFHIASEDLELRGAGEILGARQSGQIQAIGFDAYSRILAEAVAELRGEPIVRETDPEIAFDVAAYLPDTYVEDVGQRLDLYRRLSAASNDDAVGAIVEELRDRFGDLPIEARNLAQVMRCKAIGRRLRALSVELRGDKLTVRLGDDTPLPAPAALALRDRTDGRLRLATPGDRIVADLPHATADPTVQLQTCRAALAELLSLVPT